MSTWEVLKSPGVAVVLYISGHIGFLALSYTAGESNLGFPKFIADIK
jgi:hypothetical protein